MVSVIIPCHNAANWIGETLESVHGQEGVRETIVVDDGSTDGSASIVENEFPRAQLIRTPNRGASHARNTGTEAATGEFIQYLDADDLLAPGKIARQIELLQAAGADVAYGDWQRIIPVEGGFTAGEIVSRQMQSAPELELFGNFWCPPAAYLFRRRIVDRVGGWNEGLPVIQDARFALDCALLGGVFAYSPGVAAHYRMHSGGSLSRRDPLAFVRDVHRNALEIEAWWLEHGGLSRERKDVLIDVLAYVARDSYEKDRGLFESVCTHLDRLQPDFVPRYPGRLAAVSRLVGYRRAEAVAAAFRRAKRVVAGGAGA